MQINKESKKRANRLQRRETIAFWLFLSPWLLGFVFFTGGPIIASFVLSFTKYNIASPPEFLGIRNYLNLFKDSLFHKSLGVTFYYAALTIPFTVILGLVLAVLLNQKIKGQAFFRTMFYAPSIISGVSVAFLWSWLLNPDFGIVNSVLNSLFGIKGPGWFTDTKTVIPSFVLMQLTSLGGTMIIFLASLQNLPDELYEATSIDGGGPFTKFFRITVPLISPVILFNVIMTIISSFQVFTQAYVITKGGPNWMSYFYVYYLFDTAFAEFKIGYASAQAWILFIIIFLLTMLSLFVSRRLVYYEYED